MHAAEAPDEAIWEAFLRELEWVRAQMNRPLRQTFAPLFGLFELKTIILCLRNRTIGRTSEIERLLRRSLLSDSMKESLRRGGDLPEGESLQSYENHLMRDYLEEVAASRLHPVLRRFFTLFIDSRNVMLLYKQKRWNLPGKVPFIAGGSGAMPRVDETTMGDAALETILLRDMTHRLAKMRHDHDLGLLVLYIWRVYVQARNLALLHHGAGVDPEALERELIV